MACRVGTTTTPDARKEYWQRRCNGLRNWRTLHRHLSKPETQRVEEQFARQHGCDSWPGATGPERGSWNIYHFKHDGYH